MVYRYAGPDSSMTRDLGRLYNVQHCTVGWDAYDFKAKAGSLVFNIVLIISKLFIFPALNTLHPNIFLLSSFENGDSFTADLAK